LGLAQALNALPSSWQRKLTPACVSLKLKLALVWLVGLAGVELIVGAGGGVVIMLQVKVAAPLRLPTVSSASTANVWLPGAKGPEYDIGLEQALKPPPSSWQRKVTPPSGSVKLKLALVWFVGLAGVAVIDGVETPALAGDSPTTAVCHPIAWLYWNWLVYDPAVRAVWYSPHKSLEDCASKV
jgi:hypothetical protein